MVSFNYSVPVVLTLGHWALPPFVSSDFSYTVALTLVVLEIST